jgi:sugar phosphate isomerase/epimerase
MFKFACADYTFPLLERPAALKLIRLLGFDHVDLGLFARSMHFSPIDLQATPRSYAERALQDMRVAELRPSDVFVQIGVDPSEQAANDPSSRVRTTNREVFSRALEFCVAVGCKHLTGLPGVFHAAISRETALELAVAEAQWRTAECAGAEVQYAIEPHVGSICGDVEGTRRFVRRVDGMTLTLDYGHFVMSGESSAAVHGLLPFASHVHARGGALNRLQTSVSENTIDFRGMLAGLKQADFDGFLTLEYVWIDWNGCNRTDNVSETLLLRQTLQTAISGLTPAL